VDEQLADGRAVSLVGQRVDVQLHGADDLAAAAGGRSDEQHDAALGDGVPNPPPVGVCLRRVERGEEADGRPVLDGVDQDLAQPPSQGLELGRVDGSDCGPVHAESSNTAASGDWKGRSSRLLGRTRRLQITVDYRLKWFDGRHGAVRRESGENMPKVIAATFADQAAAGKGLASLAGALGGALKQGAVVNKTDSGEIKFVETKDMGTKQGAVTGGVIGAAVGIIAGPVGVIGGGAIGAGIGSLTAKLRDSGFPDDQLKGLGEDLVPGAGAIVALVDDEAVDKAQELLKVVDSDRVVVHDVSTDLADVLDQEAAAAASSPAPAAPAG
jgi:uncharacterized membrane protein